MPTFEKLIAIQKANVDVLNSISMTTLGGFDKLTKLQVKVAKELINDSHKQTHALLSAGDAQEVMAMQGEVFQPFVDKFTQYGRDVYEIMSATNEEIGKTLQAKFESDRERYAEIMEDAMTNAPVGSEAATAMMKNAVAAANNAFDSIQKVVKQASNMAEANMNAVAENASKIAKGSTAKK